MRMLIAGGGTGGHIFPGLALAEEVKTRHPRNDVLFVGTPRGLEVDILLPAHLTLDLQAGQRHIERANDALDRLLVPNQLINAW